MYRNSHDIHDMDTHRTFNQLVAELIGVDEDWDEEADADFQQHMEDLLWQAD